MCGVITTNTLNPDLSRVFFTWNVYSGLRWYIVEVSLEFLDSQRKSNFMVLRSSRTPNRFKMAFSKGSYFVCFLMSSRFLDSWDSCKCLSVRVWRGGRGVRQGGEVRRCRVHGTMIRGTDWHNSAARQRERPDTQSTLFPVVEWPQTLVSWSVMDHIPCELYVTVLLDSKFVLLYELSFSFVCLSINSRPKTTVLKFWFLWTYTVRNLCLFVILLHSSNIKW